MMWVPCDIPRIMKNDLVEYSPESKIKGLDSTLCVPDEPCGLPAYSFYASEIDRIGVAFSLILSHRMAFMVWVVCFSLPRK